MRALIERIEEGKLYIDGSLKESVSRGLLVYIAFTEGDDINTIHKMCDKIIKLRIFEDDNHKMNKSIKDINGEILLISSFSLYGDTKGNNRPSFVKSLGYNDAYPLWTLFSKELSSLNLTKTGIFGADMKINAINDGPVSIIIDM